MPYHEGSAAPRTAVIAYHQWLTGAAWIVRLGLTLLMAAVMGLAAQIRIPLPFTPVPLTAQVFVVLLSGIVLGGGYGGLSMALYLLFGFAGLPWFTGWSVGTWFGPTTGYLIGFVPAALFTGIAFPRAREFLGQALVMTTAVFIIYLFGALHIALILKTGFSHTLILAILPFIPFDIVKAVAAAGLGRVLMPGTASRDRS